MSVMDTCPICGFVGALSRVFKIDAQGGYKDAGEQVCGCCSNWWVDEHVFTSAELEARRARWRRERERNAPTLDAVFI